MPTLTEKPLLPRPGTLAALALVAWCLLSGCLPLQFGVERPSTATVPSTPSAQVTGAATATAGGSPAPTRDPVTPVAGVTPTPSSTRFPTATELLAAVTEPATATGSPTNRPTARPVSDCTLTHTVRQGERLFAIGVLYGVRWQDIASLNGLEDPGLIFAGQVLCLPPGARPPSTATRTPTSTASPTPTPTITGTASATPDLCVDPPAWFFTPVPAVCATAAAITSQAAAQRFEHGEMLWVGAVDRYFVLFDGATASTPAGMVFLPGPLDLKPGASVDNRLPETPPAGLQQPVSGFGLIWRGEVLGGENVRANLGWATQSEFAYTTTYQCQATATVEWHCYLRAPSGQLVEVAYTLNAGYVWRPVG